MDVRIKKLDSTAKTPIYATYGSACFDLHAVLTSPVLISTHFPVVIGTGLSFEIPKGHVMLVFSRSGHGFNNDVRLSNCVGVIDSDYRGEVKVKLVQDHVSSGLLVSPGDRIAQALIMPIDRVEFDVVDDLSATDRGEGGFGSTGHA